MALALLALVLSPGESPPSEPDDLCSIFEQKRHWYESARRSKETWGVPEAVQLAVIYQESGFRARARPPRKRLLWIFPGPRPSSAFGYAQVLDSTWESYARETGHRHALRDDFAEVTWFIGWYGDMIHRATAVAKDDAYHLYLAYHDGPGGFLRGTHLGQPWLLGVARQVEARADRYGLQYRDCAERLRHPGTWRVWLALAVFLAAALGIRKGLQRLRRR